ncbi:PQQ-dependent sugar dehydrogenase [Larkinella soli]|uniref:PQQ-dependent sugar dehydrogenase n=1 Tax=Larkinella soli TaxID=1770527 RepID=UPI000FFC41A5|nr:PQQ-dependent sugar dehydrogenase [Larkinella soli]
MCCFYRVFLFISCSLFAGPAVSQVPKLQLQPVASGFQAPVDLAHGGTDRLYVAEAGGRIRILESSGTVLSTPFLQIPASQLRDTKFNGIFSMAFHPDFQGNGFLYVYYARSDGYSVVSRFTRNAGNPNVADPASESVVMAIPFPDNGHRGGRLLFGPDGFLYIFLGDDGNGDRGKTGDPLGNAQNLKKPYGKILRIDVDVAPPYRIPATNPYQTPGDSIPDEIWAAGLRNPWRAGFDRQTGDLWLGDNGQDGYEEVNFVPASSGSLPAGLNFGWRCYEGSHPYVATGCAPAANFTMPLLEYAGFSNNGGQSSSVVGGFVYRGSRFPGLQGWYVYGDYAQGKLWLLRREAGSLQNTLQTPVLANPVGFGQGADGELYVLTFNEGTVYRLRAGDPTANRAPAAPAVSSLSATAGQTFRAVLPAFTDADNDYLTYSVTGLPPGLTFVPSTRTLSGTTSQTGSFTVAYAATDGLVSASVSLNLAVSAPGPVTVTGNFEGFLDRADCNSLYGWVWNRDKPNVSYTVEFLDGATAGSATVQGTTEANIFRQDLKNAGKGNGVHGFLLNTPASLRDGRAHTVWARVQGSTYLLKLSPKTVTCPTSGNPPPPPVNLPPAAPAAGPLSATQGVAFSTVLPAFTDPEDGPLTYALTGLPGGLSFSALSRTISGTPSVTGPFSLTYSATDTKPQTTSLALSLTVGTAAPPPPGPVTGNFEGYLDKADCGGLRGWVWDRNKPNTVMVVEFYEGSTVLGQVRADLFRQDLKDAGKGNGVHGYSFPIPSAFRDGRAHSVGARIAGSAYVLKGAPKTFTCAPAGRIGTAPVADFHVVVRGNPVGEELEVEVQGAESRPLRFELIDLQGRVIESRRLEKAAKVEYQRFDLRTPATGLMVLKVSTPEKSRQVRLLRR